MNDPGSHLISDSAGWMLFLGLWLLVGLTSGWKGLRAVQNARRAQDWPTTTGDLISCQLREIKPHWGWEQWEVVVRYRYQVANRVYEGSRIAEGYEASRSRAEHQALYDTLQSGRRLVVHHDPAHPAKALLSAVPSRHCAGYQLFGLFGIVVTAGLSVLLFRHGSKTPMPKPDGVDGLCLAAIAVSFGVVLVHSMLTQSGRDEALVQGIAVLDNVDTGQAL